MANIETLNRMTTTVVSGVTFHGSWPSWECTRCGERLNGSAECLAPHAALHNLPSTADMHYPAPSAPAPVCSQTTPGTSNLRPLEDALSFPQSGVRSKVTCPECLAYLADRDARWAAYEDHYRAVQDA